MKTTFVLFVLFYHLFHLCGVFSVDSDEVKSVSVLEGDSVTLHSDVTDIKSYYLTLWRFGDEGFTIVRINRDKIIYSDTSTFTDRMVLDDQTGSLTVTNTRTKHSGLYKIEISNSTGTSVKKFRLTVYDSLPLMEAEKGELKTVSVTEGDPASLMMEDVEIQRYDLIVWRYGDDGILIVKGDREDNKTTYSHDEIYGDRLKLNYQTGSLSITDTRITDTGLYKVKISSSRRAEYLRFILTVSASGLSSGGVAGIVIVVLMAMAAAVGVFVFFHRCRTSEIKKQNDVCVDKSVLMKTGDAVILHTGVKEIHEEDEITWMFEGSCIAKMRGNQTVEDNDERFKGKLKLNPQTGSLIIKNTKTEHTGLHKVKMKLQDVNSAEINVSASDSLLLPEIKEDELPMNQESQSEIEKQTESTVNTQDASEPEVKDSLSSEQKEKIKKVSVMEGDSFTLNNGEIFTQRPDVIKWEFKDIPIAELKRNTPDAALDAAPDERFRDRLELDPQTGSLTITNSRISDSGLYTLKITPGVTEEWKFSVTVSSRSLWRKLLQLKEDELPKNKESHSGILKQTESTVNTQEASEPEVKDSLSSEQKDKLCVNEGDPFTLSSGQTELGDNVMTWRFKDEPVATVSERQSSVEERFRDRVHVDPQTGSLTITKSRTEDSGLYYLEIKNSKGKKKLEKKFTVTVLEKIKKVSVNV